MATQAEKDAAIADWQAALSATGAGLAHAQSLVVDGAPPPPPPPPPPPGTFPAWRQGKTVGQVYAIPGTENFSGLRTKDPGRDDSMFVESWIGYALDARGIWWNPLAGGHATTVGFDWQNTTTKIDFRVDAPAWSMYHDGSDFAAVTLTERYRDGLPCGRHTYYTPQYIPAGVMPDGAERVMCFTCWAAYALAIGGYGGGPEVVGFKVADRQWEPNGAHPNYPLPPPQDYMPAVCKDARTHDVYVCGAGYQIQKWSANSDSWSTFVAQGKGVLNGQLQGSLIDVVRNRHVLLCDGKPYSNPGVLRLQCVDLTTRAISFIYVTGPLPGAYENGFVHDLDNDRYVSINGTTVYAIDPTTAVSTIIGSVMPCAGTNAPLSRLAYLPDQGCIVYLARYSAPIQFIPTR